jgi:hypothetical protein
VLGDWADRTGLTAGLSPALAPLTRRQRVHDRGQALIRLAVSIAGGAHAERPHGLAAPPGSFWHRGSTPTGWPTLVAFPDAFLARMAATQIWAAGLAPGLFVIDIDGTLVIADQIVAAPTSKGGDGLSLLVATLEATGEPLPRSCAPGMRGRAPPRIISPAGRGPGANPGGSPPPGGPYPPRQRGAFPCFSGSWHEPGAHVIVGDPLTGEMVDTVIGRRRLRGIPAITADGTAERDLGKSPNGRRTWT